MTTPTVTIALDSERAQRPHPVKTLLRDPVAIAAAVYLLVLVVAAVFAEVIAPYDPNASDLSISLAPPSAEHLLGGDVAGRDVFSRLVFATRYSLLGALIALGVALIVGVVSGLVAGYFGRWFDGASSWVTTLNMALPGIIVLLAARAVFGPSLWLSMVIFGLLLSPAYFRLVRTLVKSVRAELYIDAAKVSGLSDLRIIFRHVLNNVRGPIILQSSIVMAIAIGVQAGLEVLGLGDLAVPGWGAMLNEALSRIYVAPHLILISGTVIVLTCVALGVLSNSIRDALQERRPRVKSRHAVQQQETAAATDSVAGPPGVMLAAHDLEVSYPDANGAHRSVVHGVSLEVRAGEVLGLIGESGSGKSQTAFAIMGLLPQGGMITRGHVWWKGADVTHASERKRAQLRGPGIAYIPQEPMSNLDPSFRIGSQLTAPMRQHLGISRAEARRRARDLLARVGIHDPDKTMRAYPHEISGGMAQRVLIAGAVSCDPELIIADEPTTALDVTVQAEVLELLRGLQKERGMALLLVTHNFGVVADLCDRVAVMQKGLIVEESSVADVFDHPQHPYTRSLLDDILENEPVRPAVRPAMEGLKA
ncbi:dipeptide/oligopeptide/nickel ABC transporter permease/ATP-binding protein [Microbacterium sp. NPDC058062]|uniref:dipeptide/oligopeptide/nickel ABC transporter permease/ATP-binding protein n=1 Tax=Microbacterium sp. NPDC058062 TaxID=3346320 RepID=UPI0036DA8FEA